MTYSQVYRRGVELHPQTAVLLRAPVPGASPLAFSVLRGRPLLGRVTRWSWDVKEDFPGCTGFERHQSARKLGQAQARLAAEQAPSGVGDDVYVGVVDRDGRPSGPDGLVAEHTVILPWTCNAQALVREGIRHGGGPGQRWKPIEFQEECPDNSGEGCFAFASRGRPTSSPPT